MTVETPSKSSIAILRAASLLQAGKLVAIPTETVYGLAADAKNSAAVKRIFEVKGRPPSNPLIIHIASLEEVQDFAINVPAIAWDLMDAFWPGPLTIVLEKHASVPSIVTGNQETVALRVPNHPVALALLEAFGGGLAAPSANRYGRLSPTTAQHVKAELGNLVDEILEGGASSIGIESTIVHVREDSFSILRPGAITAEVLETVTGKKQQQQRNLGITTPGSNVAHYAPRTPLYLIESETENQEKKDFEKFIEIVQKFVSQNLKVGVLSFRERPEFLSNENVEWLEQTMNHERYAQRLYAQLHTLDHQNLTCILVESPPETTNWISVRDRLIRASSLLPKD